MPPFGEIYSNGFLSNTRSSLSSSFSRSPSYGIDGSVEGRGQRGEGRGETETRDTRHETRDTRHETRDTRHETRDTRHETRDRTASVNAALFMELVAFRTSVS
jgi:hypothetical protein